MLKHKIIAFILKLPFNATFLIEELINVKIH